MPPPVKPGDRVTRGTWRPSAESAFFAKRLREQLHRSKLWRLGAELPRIDGFRPSMSEVPFADRGLNKIQEALPIGRRCPECLATGFWAARISEITRGYRC